MPLFEAPPSAMPTGRIPTPTEFVAEAVRRNTWDPRAVGVATMVAQIALAAHGPGATHPAELREHLRMGALLALVVDGVFDEITEHAAAVQPPAWAVAGPPLDREQALWLLHDALRDDRIPGEADPS